MRGSARNRLNEEAVVHSGEQWLTTFADLLFLLVTFFVLQFALQPMGAESQDQEIPPDSYPLELAENDFRQSIQDKFGGSFVLAAEGLRFGKDLVFRRDRTALEIEIDSPVLDTDPSDLTFRSKEYVSLIASIADERGLAIRVEGIVNQTSCSQSRPEAQLLETQSSALERLRRESAEPVIIPTATSAAELGIAAIRQIVDTGFPTSRISATGDNCRSDSATTRYRLHFLLSRAS